MPQADDFLIGISHHVLQFLDVNWVQAPDPDTPAELFQFIRLEEYLEKANKCSNSVSARSQTYRILCANAQVSPRHRKFPSPAHPVHPERPVHPSTLSTLSTLHTHHGQDLGRPFQQHLQPVPAPRGHQGLAWRTQVSRCVGPRFAAAHRQPNGPACRCEVLKLSRSINAQHTRPRWRCSGPAPGPSLSMSKRRLGVR